MRGCFAAGEKGGKRKKEEMEGGQGREKNPHPIKAESHTNIWTKHHIQ